jgi:uncharacterized membrane protein
MTSLIVTILLWVTALSSGVMAGVYFAFSAFVMRAFGTLEPAQAVTAMNAVNITILRSLFMPLFFGSSIISALLVVAGVMSWGEAGAGMALLAGAIYFFGMFACTVLFNVPLNNALGSLAPNSTDDFQLWTHDLQTWTNWNHLRTISSFLTCSLCIWLLSSH